MTANTPIRAATSGDLVNLRSNNQAALFGLAINKPASVYTARVNQIFATSDSIIEIEYDGASGTLANVLAGMTLYIGSAAGARDRGVVRIRKTPTVTKLYIGAASIQISDNDYLTVVNEFALWGRDAVTQGGIVKMDSDILFASRTGAAIIRAAPMVAVIKRVAGVATFTPPSPALSACYDGTTISSWAYSAPGAASTSNMTSGTGTASWTYSAAGQYRWSLSVTDSASRVTTTHRWVIVDNTSPNFAISQDPEGNFSDGSWSFGVTMYDNATTADIVDRALVTLYTEHEYFAGVEATLGKLAGYENIVCTGFIDGESVVRDSQNSTVTFTIYGASYWLDKIRAAAFGLESKATTPTKWTQIEDMTPDKALAQILSWASTAPLIMDCFFTGDTTPINIIAQPSGSLLSQLNSAAGNTIFANVVTNNLGQMYIQTDPQIMTSAQRAALVTVQTITTADYEGQLEITRLTSPSNSMIELECNTYDGNKVRPIYSRAPGNTGLAYGEYDAPSNYAAVDQAECNRLAGCLLAIRNPLYDTFEVVLSQNRLVDIAPAQYCEISIAAGDTPRGITLTNQKIIPRSVKYQMEGGYYKTVVEFEPASSPVDGIAYFPPKPVNTNVGSFEIGESGFGDFPSPIIDFPIALTDPVVTPANCKTSTDIVNAPGNSFTLTWDKQQLLGTGATAADRTATAWFPCSIRKTGCVYGTSVYIAGYFQGVSSSNIHVYGVKDGAQIITATCAVGLYGISATFAPASATVVDGFQILLDAGTGFAPGAVLSSGTVQANNASGVAIAVTSGLTYAIDGSGGPWKPGVAFTQTMYNFSINGTGNIGRDGIVGVFVLVTPNDCEASEQITTLYGRVYFIAAAASVIFRVQDSDFADNSGSLGYILREATGTALIANISGSNANNVCAA